MSDPDYAPMGDHVYIAAVSYPICGEQPEFVIGTSEEQAKEALLEYWRVASPQRQRARRRALDAEFYGILGFNPPDLPEESSGSPFDVLEVKSWEDLRKIYCAYVHPVAFGEIDKSTSTCSVDPAMHFSRLISYLELDEEPF